MPTGKDYLRDIATRADHIYEKLKEVLEQLGGDPEEAVTPILSNYPRIDKKELPVGITTIDTRRGTVTLPDDSIEVMSSSVPDQTCRSILVYANKNIDFIALDGDATMFSSTIFASWLRIEGIAFDRIKITTTAPTSFYIAVSNTHAPSIEALATSVNKPTFYTAKQDVTIAGTAEQLDAQAIPDGYSVYVKAKRTNTGYIYPGESKSQAEAHNVELDKKEAVSLSVDNLSDIWIDCSVAGEGVEIIVEAD